MEFAPERRPNEERRLAPAEVNAVLARAIELQVRDEEEPARERLSESDLVRIGAEVGLELQHVRCALAEVDGGLHAHGGRLDRHVGPRTAGASRVVRRPAAEVEGDLDAYLRERECMVVERRLRDRTTYVRGTGVVADIERLLGRMASRHALLDADRVEVAVQQLDETSSCVVVAVDLTARRREAVGLAGAAAAAGGAAAGVGAFVLAPPVALAAIPAVAAAALGARLAQRHALAQATRRLDSLLDRLEHRELELRRGVLLRALRR